MPVTLDAPFSWENASADDRKMLEGLQPNILKPHVRDYLTVLFLRFDQSAGGRSFLTALTSGTKPLVKSALAHLQEIKAFKKDKKKKGSAYVGVGLTPAGYTALGIAPARQPKDPAFRAGMKAGSLQDPPPSTWDKHFQGPIHAVVVVGDADQAGHDAALAKVMAILAARPSVIEVGRQEGLGLHNANGHGIEHFGYVDGRSQPLFLTEDVEAERLGSDGTSSWNPAFGPGRAIVPDSAAADPAHDFGSYFVFRKLEQDVKRFKEEELALAKRLKLDGDEMERAGAMLVGRFEDGSPLTLQRAEGAHSSVLNDFNYSSDPQGGKCPFFGHIRKMNPRGSGGFEAEADERKHIMARRGQTYGHRADNPNDGDTDNKPSGGVGLLFMAFNSNIGEQFAFVQSVWANNAGFPATPTPVPPLPPKRPDLDPIIGQGARGDVHCPVRWGDSFNDHRKSKPVPQTVTMKGGEYFFMPSLAFLRNPV